MAAEGMTPDKPDLDEAYRTFSGTDMRVFFGDQPVGQLLSMKETGLMLPPSPSSRLMADYPPVYADPLDLHLKSDLSPALGPCQEQTATFQLTYVNWDVLWRQVEKRARSLRWAGLLCGAAVAVIAFALVVAYH